MAADTVAIRSATPEESTLLKQITVRSRAHWKYDAALLRAWAEPEWMGRGLGAQLFRFAARRALELGAETLEWASEPGAVGFYEKMGAGTYATT